MYGLIVCVSCVFGGSLCIWWKVFVEIVMIDVFMVGVDRV